ncbi:MAG: hypothetical protein NVS9B4_13790 [Candidatus Acidiferrum sp.]
MHTLFAFLLTLQFIAVAFHDLLNIPGWTNTAAVASIVGRRKLLLATFVNSMFPGLAMAFAFYYWNSPTPRFVGNYWLAYCAITLISVIAMWYVPYLFGASEKQKHQYSVMYAGTRHVLPPRADNPRPNLLHVCFHTLFVINFVLVLFLRYEKG